MFKRLLTSSKLSALTRSIIAIIADRLHNGRSLDSKAKMELPDDFFEHLCKSDGWDPKKYRSIQAQNNKNL